MSEESELSEDSLDINNQDNIVTENDEKIIKQQIQGSFGSINGFYSDKHSLEYEKASTMLKNNESMLKEAETKLKYEEISLKNAQVAFKNEETLLKKEDVSYRKQDIEYRKQDAENRKQDVFYREKEILLKEQEYLLKKTEVRLKGLECDRYEQETKHQKTINTTVETTLSLRNLQIRLSILQEIGLKFDGVADFETLIKMSELLGDPIPEEMLSSLKPIGSKIIKNNQTRDSMYQ